MNNTTKPKTVTPDCWVVSGFSSSFGPEIFPAQRVAINEHGHQIVRYKLSERPALDKAEKRTSALTGYSPIEETNIKPSDVFNTADEALEELRRRLSIKIMNMKMSADRIYQALLVKGALKI